MNDYQLQINFFISLTFLLVFPNNLKGTEHENSLSRKDKTRFVYSLHFGHSPPPPQKPKIDVLLNGDDRKQFIQFCKAPLGDSSMAISRVTFNPGWHGFHQISKNDAAMKQMVRELHNAELEVYLSTGDSSWADEGTTTTAEKILDNILHYNRNAKPEERFDGLHLDVEPYVLGTHSWHKLSWRNNTEQVWARYLNVLDLAIRRVDRYKQEMQHNLILGEAIPDWFAAEFNPKTLQGSFKEVIDRMDYVWIMAYRDDAKVIINSVKDELQYADQKNKNVVVGLLVHGADHIYSPSDDETFIEEGYQTLKKAITRVRHEFRNNSAFNELGIFIYESFAELKLNE